MSDDPNDGLISPDDATESSNDQALSNYGLTSAQLGLWSRLTYTRDPGLLSARGFQVMPFDIVVARAFLAACENSIPRVAYHMGRKASSVSSVPGKDFSALDCSGFARQAVLRATRSTFKFPDGSVNQHDWCAAQGFESQVVSDGGKSDGATRIAFLRPQDGHNNIGHVTLLNSGTTLESHYGIGPDTRPWTAQGWQARCTLFRLT